MKLSQLHIQHYRQFDDLKLDLTYPEGHEKAGQPLDKVCFIGQSGTGKTTLLRFVYSLAGRGPGASYDWQNYGSKQSIDANFQHFERTWSVNSSVPGSASFSGEPPLGGQSEPLDCQVLYFPVENDLNLRSFGGADDERNPFVVEEPGMQYGRTVDRRRPQALLFSDKFATEIWEDISKKVRAFQRSEADLKIRLGDASLKGQQIDVKSLKRTYLL